MADVGARTADEIRELSSDAVMKAKGIDFQHAPRSVSDTTYPILDGYVLPVDPLTAFREGRYNDMPLLTGSNTHERTLSPFNQDTETYLADSRALFGSCK